MYSHKIFAAVIIVIFVSGCGAIKSNQVRQSVMSDPNLSAEMRRIINENKIRVGMTKAQVIASWGSPCGHCYGTRQRSSGDSWEYNIFGSSYMGAGSGTYLYFDNKGILQHWSR